MMKVYYHSIWRVRKIAKSDYYRHVCPSAWNTPASTVRIFMTFDI